MRALRARQAEDAPRRRPETPQRAARRLVEDGTCSPLILGYQTPRPGTDD